MVPTLLLANRPLLYFARVRIMDIIVALRGHPVARRWRRRNVHAMPRRDQLPGFVEEPIVAST
jgi:hypothetical protein